MKYNSLILSTILSVALSANAVAAQSKKHPKKKPLQHIQQLLEQLKHDEHEIDALIQRGVLTPEQQTQMRQYTRDAERTEQDLKNADTASNAKDYASDTTLLADPNISKAHDVAQTAAIVHQDIQRVIQDADKIIHNGTVVARDSAIYDKDIAIIKRDGQEIREGQRREFDRGGRRGFKGGGLDGGLNRGFIQQRERALAELRSVEREINQTQKSETATYGASIRDIKSANQTAIRLEDIESLDADKIMTNRENRDAGKLRVLYTKLNNKWHQFLNGRYGKFVNQESPVMRQIRQELGELKMTIQSIDKNMIANNYANFKKYEGMIKSASEKYTTLQYSIGKIELAAERRFHNYVHERGTLENEINATLKSLQHRLQELRANQYLSPEQKSVFTQAIEKLEQGYRDIAKTKDLHILNEHITEAHKTLHDLNHAISKAEHDALTEYAYLDKGMQHELKVLLAGTKMEINKIRLNPHFSPSQKQALIGKLQTLYKKFSHLGSDSKISELRNSIRSFEKEKHAIVQSITKITYDNRQFHEIGQTIARANKDIEGRIKSIETNPFLSTTQKAQFIQELRQVMQQVDSIQLSGNPKLAQQALKEQSIAFVKMNAAIGKSEQTAFGHILGEELSVRTKIGKVISGLVNRIDEIKVYPNLTRAQKTAFIEEILALQGKFTAGTMQAQTLQGLATLRGNLKSLNKDVANFNNKMATAAIQNAHIYAADHNAVEQQIKFTLDGILQRINSVKANPYLSTSEKQQYTQQLHNLMQSYSGISSSDNLQQMNVALAKQHTILTSVNAKLGAAEQQAYQIYQQHDRELQNQVGKTLQRLQQRLVEINAYPNLTAAEKAKFSDEIHTMINQYRNDTSDKNLDNLIEQMTSLKTALYGLNERMSATAAHQATIYAAQHHEIQRMAAGKIAALQAHLKALKSNPYLSSQEKIKYEDKLNSMINAYRHAVVPAQHSADESTGTVLDNMRREISVIEGSTGKTVSQIHDSEQAAFQAYQQEQIRNLHNTTQIVAKKLQSLMGEVEQSSNRSLANRGQLQESIADLQQHASTLTQSNDLALLTPKVAQLMTQADAVNQLYQQDLANLHTSLSAGARDEAIMRSQEFTDLGDESLTDKNKNKQQ